MIQWDIKAKSERGQGIYVRGNKIGVVGKL